MVVSVPQAHQWLTARRIIAALVVVVCLSAPVAGVAGETGQSSAPNGTSVGFKNQTATNSTVTIERVTLSDNGFVSIHTASKNGSLGAASLIGVSKHLSIGTHRNITIDIPQLNHSQTLVAVPYHDANDDNQFNATKVFGKGSIAFSTKSGTVRDTARVRASTNDVTSKRAGGQNQTNGTASVVFANQTTNGTAVTVSSATLPEGGYVVLHSDPMSQIGYLEPTMIAVSDYLAPGTHRNITISVSHSPPGGLTNRTRLDESGRYSVGLYRDTNGNQRFEYVLPGKEVDEAYFVGSKSNTHIASDSTHITVPGSNTPTPTASIQFENQTARGSTVTIESVSLPDGGFVVIHNAGYLHSSPPLTTVIGHSDYLAPGTHRNVAVALNETVRQKTTLVAIPARDTNGNQRYDFISSDGFQDVAYTGDGLIISDQATISPPKSFTSTSTSTPTPTSTPTSTSTSTPSPGSQNTSQPSIQPHDKGESDGDTGIDISPVNLVAACLLLVVGGYVIFYARS